jgi:hypothetical protein
VIPCAVVGSERALPPGQRLAMPCQPVWLDIGQALQPADHASAEAFAQAAWADVGSRLAQLEATAATTSPKSHSHPSG